MRTRVLAYSCRLSTLAPLLGTTVTVMRKLWWAPGHVSHSHSGQTCQAVMCLQVGLQRSACDRFGSNSGGGVNERNVRGIGRSPVISSVIMSKRTILSASNHRLNHSSDRGCAWDNVGGVAGGLDNLVPCTNVVMA